MSIEKAAERICKAGWGFIPPDWAVYIAAVISEECEPKKCVWTWDENHCYYDTSCGEGFTFTYGKKDKNFKTCPYCGGSIEVKDGD